jgi:DNA-binding MarR family transcriptional regulator
VVSEKAQSDEVVAAVLTASRALVAVSARSIAEVDDTLTLPQFRCLVVLRTRGPVNLTAVAEALAVNTSTALRTVDRLVAADLAERRDHPESRREVLLSTTVRGRRVVDRVTARRRREVAAILERMPASRRTALVAAFEAFARAADEPSVDVTQLIGW